MSSKDELLAYLANLVIIMDSKEKVGIPRGKTLSWEYNRVYDEYVTILREEKEDEAGTSKREQPRGNEARAYPPQSFTGGSGSAGTSYGNPQSYGNSVSREGLRGTSSESDDDTQGR